MSFGKSSGALSLSETVFTSWIACHASGLERNPIDLLATMLVMRVWS